MLGSDGNAQRVVVSHIAMNVPQVHHFVDFVTTGVADRDLVPAGFEPRHDQRSGRTGTAHNQSSGGHARYSLQEGMTLPPSTQMT